MKALLFTVDSFQLKELETMQSDELLELAEQSDMLDGTARVMSLQQLAFEVNNDYLDLNHSFLFFV